MVSAVACSQDSLWSLQGTRGPGCGAGVLGWVTNPPRLPQNLRSKSASTSTTPYGLGQCRQLLPRRRRHGEEESILGCCLGGGGGGEDQQVRRPRSKMKRGAYGIKPRVLLRSIACRQLYSCVPRRLTESNHRTSAAAAAAAAQHQHQQ